MKSSLSENDNLTQVLRLTLQCINEDISRFNKEKVALNRAVHHEFQFKK